MIRRCWQWPTPILGGVFLVAIALLVGLGTWQVYRLQWKTALITRIADQLTLPSIALPTADDLDEAAARAGLDFRRVRVDGVFLHESERHWWRPSIGGLAGYHILTPLRRETGEIVWIDRGWVPPELKEPASRPLSQVTGVQHIEGITRLPVRRGIFTPENNPDKNLWYTNDPQELIQGRLIQDRSADLAATGAVFPLIVDSVSPVPGGHPVPGQTQITLNNPHLGYAITWYGLAFALTAVFLFYHWRPIRI
ncbi:MAG: SURF1 family protein [Alphaproteobacteria bacterium]